MVTEPWLLLRGVSSAKQNMETLRGDEKILDCDSSGDHLMIHVCKKS